MSVLIGGVAGALGGVLVGAFCVRLSGAYFALLTLAFNQFLYAVALKSRSLTGGDDGIGLTRPDIQIPLIGEINMMSTVNMYFLTIVVVLVCFISCWYFLRTPYGNTIICVKENEERAKFIGYNVYLSKVVLFAAAAFFAGVSGSLFALFEEFVSLDAINITMSTEILFMTFIGGTGSFFGPILGASVYIYFTEWMSRITERWEFFLGLLFILLILYAHKGLIGLVPSKVKGLLAVKPPRGKSPIHPP
jgi:branched-chain amino acid transport system permease protein